MDNLYEILFFLLIFILSGLSSYFENKKKRKAGNVKKKVPAKLQKDSARDILEQILGYKTESPPKPAPPVNVDNSEFKSWNPEEEFEREPERYTETLKALQPEKTNDTVQKSESGKPKFESVHKESKSDISIELQSDYRKNILEKLKNPETLREMVLISEILGKPKALRR